MYNNKRLILSICWMILGAVLVGFSVAGKLDPVYSGMGGALIAVGALQVIRNIRYRSDKAYRENIDTEVNDERNRFLRMKSWAYAGYIVVLIEGIGVVIATVTGNETVRSVLAYSVCLIVAAYWISYVILSRKY